mmetsp:Transcript_29347/g.44784  ORF Transcript_29347/g.44784 Transcript_29347/m.44784 type:complete len:88 (-) Transcript_29347:210-473(-)
MHTIHAILSIRQSIQSLDTNRYAGGWMDGCMDDGVERTELNGASHSIGISKRPGLRFDENTNKQRESSDPFSPNNHKRSSHHQTSSP